MADTELSGIVTLVFAEDNDDADVSTAVALKAISQDTVTAYEAFADGCIRGISATVETAPGSGFTNTFTVYVAGSATTVLTTIAATATTGYAEFPTTQALVTAGDAIQVYFKESASGGTAPSNILVHVLYQLGKSQI